MGCNSSKIDPTYQSTARHLDYANGSDYATSETSVFSAKTIAADDALIHKLKSSNEQMDIQVLDPQAFSNSLIQQRQQAIDNRSYRSAIESCQPKTLQQLADTIRSIGKGRSRVDQHWLIFYWVTCNISYDTVSYFSGKFENQSADAVFRTRKGVCAGYANLYKYLSDYLQMPCEVVSGYSKGYGFEYRKNPPARTDHAWNAVEIDSHWYLVEPTWGSGHLNAENKFEHKLDTYYFLPRPNEMIYHHVPENERWQLLRSSVRLETFMLMPHLRPLYFSYKVDLVYPRNQVHLSLLPGRSYAMVLLRAPPDVHFVSDLRYKEENIDGTNHVFYDKRKQLYRFYFAPSNVGKDKITIYAKRGEPDVGEYVSVLDFVIDIKQLPKHIVSFPKTWSNFFDLGLEIISPQNTHKIELGPGKNQARVSIKAPDNVEMVGRLKRINGEEIKDGDHTYFDRQSNIWHCDFAPNREGLYEAQILAKTKSNSGNYTSAVAFKLEAKQISSKAVTYAQTWPLFYELGLQIESPKNTANAIWSENVPFSEVLIHAPKDVEVSGQIVFNSNQIQNGSLAQFDHERKLWQLLFAPERPGAHELIIFARKSTDSSTSSDAVIKFNLNVTKLQRPIKFPMTYTQFQTKKCQIYEPLDGTVRKGAMLPIYCIVPGAKDVTVAVDGQVQGKGGYSNPVFSREIKAGSSNVLICADFGQKTGYDGLIQYNVR